MLSDSDGDSGCDRMWDELIIFVEEWGPNFNPNDNQYFTRVAFKGGKDRKGGKGDKDRKGGKGGMDIRMGGSSGSSSSTSGMGGKGGKDRKGDIGGNIGKGGNSGKDDNIGKGDKIGKGDWRIPNRIPKPWFPWE